MAEEAHLPETGSLTRKRRPRRGKVRRRRKKKKLLLGPKQKAKKIDPKLRKFLMKKSRDYDSYDEEEDREEVEVENREEGLCGRGKVGTFTGQRDDLEEEELSGSEDEEGDGDEEGEEGGITWFADGCRAFRIAFKSIMKIGVDDYDPLGPVLSARKKFVALRSLPRRKLKRKVEEKGHAKPASYLVTHEKILIGVATKGGLPSPGLPRSAFVVRHTG